jgi:hypothetical protein
VRAAVSLVLATASCLPIATPPLRAEVGAQAQIGGERHLRYGGGAHVASAVPDLDFPLDIGAGYIATDPISVENRPTSHGIYAEGGPRIAGGSFWRAFATGRAEYYFAPAGPDLAYAGMARIAVELAAPVKFEPIESSSNKGFYLGVALGAFAVGAYAEAGYQRLVSDAGFSAIGTGLTLRLPATFGIVCCAWDFK